MDNGSVGAEPGNGIETVSLVKFLFAVNINSLMLKLVHKETTIKQAERPSTCKIAPLWCRNIEKKIDFVVSKRRQVTPMHFGSCLAHDKLESRPPIVSCEFYASFVLGKLPFASITRRTHANHARLN